MKATFVLTLRNWSIGFGFPGGIAVAVLYLGPLIVWLDKKAAQKPVSPSRPEQT